MLFQRALGELLAGRTQLGGPVSYDGIVMTLSSIASGR